MPSEMYKQGWGMGYMVARSCAREISRLWKSELAGFVGEKLEVQAKKEGPFNGENPKWRMGFFDGAMDAAEEILP